MNIINLIRYLSFNSNNFEFKFSRYYNDNLCKLRILSKNTRHKFDIFEFTDVVFYISEDNTINFQFVYNDGETTKYKNQNLKESEAEYFILNFSNYFN